MGCLFSKKNKKKKNIIITNENTRKYKIFIPPIKGGKVIKVYDGDTITIVTKIEGLKNSEIYKFSIRLAGIDCPEIRGKNEEEKEVAKFVRDKLREKILNKDVTLSNLKKEKYGRVLCDVYLKELHINKWLLDNRYAIKYDGKAKNCPSSWKKYLENS